MTLTSLVLLASLLAEVKPADMQVLIKEPIAMRGSVLMLPLVTVGSDQPWPDRIMVQLVQGDEEVQDLVGHIGWIEPIQYTTSRTWSVDSRAVRIRPVRKDDRFNASSMRSDGGPRLLVALPETGNGMLRLGRSMIPLRWMDSAQSMPAIRVGDRSREGVLEAINAPDLPSADNALDWWRWELIAERRGMEPPPPEFDSIVERLAARHVSGLWRLAMTRLANGSRGVAARCRDLLTETCQDGDVVFAAWITEPSSLDQLLNVLLDTRIDESTRTKAALSWADERIPQVAWIDQPFGPRPGLRLANPEPRDVLAELVWSSGDDVPLGVGLDANSVTNLTARRPMGSHATNFSRMDILNIVVRNHVQRFSFGDAIVPISPPGPILGPFLPALTLPDARSQDTPEVPQDHRSWLQLRRWNGQWELYVECMRQEQAHEATKPLPAEMATPNEMIGIEAVTLLLGSSSPGAPWPGQWIAISPHDGWRRYRSDQPDRPSVGVRTQGDRWLASIIIPDSWVPPEGTPLLLAAIRTHEDTSTFETLPTSCVPWRLEPKPIYLDPGAWDRGDKPSLRTAGSRRSR